MNLMLFVSVIGRYDDGFVWFSVFLRRMSGSRDENCGSAIF